MGKAERLLTTAAPGHLHRGQAGHDCASRGSEGKSFGPSRKVLQSEVGLLSLPGKLIRAGVARQVPGGRKLWLLHSVPTEAASLTSMEPYRKK